MERLNDILGKAAQRGQQHAGQRSSQNTEPHGPTFAQSQQSDLRHAVPEQTARLGQRHPYGSQPYHQSLPATRTRYTSGQGEPVMPENREGRPPSSTGTRPLYPRQQSAGPRTRPPYDRSRPQLPRSRPLESDDYLQSDDYPSGMRADVVEEWEDDAVDMRYGDWERDRDEVPLYQHQRANAEFVEAPRTSYPHTTRSLPSVSEAEMRSRMTRDLRLPTTQSPLSPIRTQGVPGRPSYSRTTQPLNPQTMANLGREREREFVPEPVNTQQTMRHSRQIVPHEIEHYLPATTKPQLSPKSVCPKCRGAGYLRSDVPFGHPQFGKPIRCECKEAEQKGRRRQQLRDMSNLDAFRNSSFKTFNSSVPGVREAFLDAKAYAENPDGWLLLVGPNGCGKTHLAAAIANQCLDNGSVVLFAVAPDLLDHLRAAFAPTANEVYDQLFAKMREAEVLVLDDLGAQQSSPWANEKLFQLLNYRYNMEMPTVITANQKGLQGIDERIRSRLSDVGLVIKVAFDRAHDYRPNHPRRDM